MHYKNGREAQEGDHVVTFIYRGGTTPKATVGVIHSLSPGSTSCNAQLAYPIPGGTVNTCVNVGDCWHAEDARGAVEVLHNQKMVPMPEAQPQAEPAEVNKAAE